MIYRAEIDGLRALAVLPVILFHAGFEWFGGGFIGVDVFFVISGYLITTIIISEINDGRFNIAHFYERRARRILPALFFIMLICLPFAWFWLTPNDLKDFGQSLIAVSTFSSNILFWVESGYFNTAAELKPLLHTWSLAVEEQYYILFPFFLMLIWRLGINWVLILLSIIFLISLGIAQWGAYNSPSAAFYLLPTRGWEILIGVFTAFYLKHNTHLQSHYTNQIFSLVGFGMIIFSMIVFDESTPFPSFYTLIPTIGTGLLILCAVPKTFVYKFLSLKLFVGIGLISYSAYLWHQPLLAFTRHKIHGDVSELILIILCIVSLLLAWFSWHFVEKPFRSQKILSRNFVFQFSILGILIFSSIGLYTYYNDGFFNRFSALENKVLSFKNFDRGPYYRENVCLLAHDQSAENFKDECLNGKNLIWGDSHAAALSFGLRTIDNFSQLTASGCPPLVNLQFIDSPNCLNFNDRVLDYVKEGLFTTVYLHSNWIRYDSSEISNPVENIDELLLKTIQELLLIDPNLQIKIIGGVPQWQPSLPDMLIKNSISSTNFEDASMIKNHMFLRVKERDDEFIQALNTYQEKSNIEFVSLLDKFCKDQKCVSIVSECGLFEPTAWDYGHLGKLGSKLAARLILEDIELPVLECSL